MTALSDTSLLAPHLRRGLGTSILIAVLVAVTVFVVAVAPRASALLGTAELRHEFAAQRSGAVDLTGQGRLGYLQSSPDAPVEQLVGSTDSVLSKLVAELPSPLADGAETAQWVVRTKQAVVGLPSASEHPGTVTVVASLTLAVDLLWESRVTFLEGAAPAAWEGQGDDPEGPAPIEVAVSSTAAANMGVSVGDLLGYGPAPLLVAGIYEANDESEPYWAHARDLLRGAVIQEQGRPPRIQAGVYLDPQSLVPLQDRFGEGDLSAWIHFDPAVWDYADREALLLQVRNFSATPLSLPNYGELSFRTSMADVIEEAQTKVAASTALVALSSSGFLGVLLATYALSIQALIRRRSSAFALLDARGARRGQLRRILVLETALIAIPGTLLATALAALLLPARVGVDGWLAPLVVGSVPVVLAALLLQPGSLREERRDLGGRARGSLRWVAEVAVVGLAALALLLLQRRGLAESSAVVGVDPLLAATPVLLAAAVGLLVLRLYPLPLRALHSVARRRSLPALSLGSARAVREPAVGVVATLALVVGMAIVVFTVVMVSTVGDALRQSARDQVGADVRLSVHDMPDTLVSDIRNLPGVTAAVALVSKSAVSFTDESGPVDVTVVLADTAQLHGVRPDIPALGGKDGGAIPVLFSSDWASQIDGTDLSLVNSGVSIAGTIAPGALPGVSRQWVLVDISAAKELGLSGQTPYAILARLTDLDAGRGPVAEQIAALARDAQPAQFADSVMLDTAAAALDDLSSAPAVAAVQSALLVVAVGTLLLTALVVALATAAAASARGRVIGVVRVLGMSRRQVAALTAWELAPVAVVSLVVAAGLGLALPPVVLAALDLRGFVGGDAVPGPTVEPLWLLAAVVVFAAVVALSSAAATAIGRRIAPARTIRMGE